MTSQLRTRTNSPAPTPASLGSTPPSTGTAPVKNDVVVKGGAKPGLSAPAASQFDATRSAHAPAHAPAAMAPPVIADKADALFSPTAPKTEAKGHGSLDRSKAPIDVSKPFDAKAEAKALDAAVFEGAKNHWSVLHAAVPEGLATWAKFIKDTSAELSPDHAAEVYVRAMNTVGSAHLQQTKDVQRYLKSLPDPVTRGPLFQGYADEIFVPEGRKSGDFKTLEKFLEVIQGKSGRPLTVAAKFVNALKMNTLASTPRGRAILRAVLRDPSLNFHRVMLTPFAEEDGQDGGYSQTNPLKVDPRFGGDEARASFSKAARGRGLELLADQIDNHCSVLHERVQAVMNGDLSRLPELVDWSGAVKVGEIPVNGQQHNVLVHTGANEGAVSTVWAIFPDSNPDSLYRLNVPLKGEWQDLSKVRSLVGNQVALDDVAKAEIRAVYAETGLPTPDENKLRHLPAEATAKLADIRQRNDERVFGKLQAALDRGETPELEVDLLLSFMGNIQYDKNLANPNVLQESFDGMKIAALMGQSGIRFDAIIHAGKVAGSDQLNQPKAQAYMKIAAAMTHMMIPGRVVVPEAFLPPEIIASDWLKPSIEVAGKQYSVMGDLAISFASAINNTESIRGGVATPYRNYVKERLETYGEVPGHLLAYACRLHDEALMNAGPLAELIEDGTLIDPFKKLDAETARLEAEGKTLEPAEAFAMLRAQLEDPSTLTNFADRAAGDDISVVLKSGKHIAQSLALLYAGPDMPSVSSRLVVGAGNSVDFALQRMQERLELQVANGEPVNYRKAFDARDLGRGPIPEALWKQRIAEKYAPLEMVRALNTLWNINTSVASRDVRVLDNANPAVASFARGGGSAAERPLLQLLNVSEEPQRVTLSAATLEKEFGWSLDGPGKPLEFTDILGSEIAGKGVRVSFERVGDEVTLELPPQASLYLQRPSDARIGWLSDIATKAKKQLASVGLDYDTFDTWREASRARAHAAHVLRGGSSAGESE